MSSKPTTSDKFRGEIEKVLDYFRKEFSLSYSEAIGVLEIVKHGIVCEMIEGED